MRYSFFPSLLVLSVLLLTIGSCDQRDPQAEYQILREQFFPNPQGGIDAAQEYIDHFYKKKESRVNEVGEIRHQYRIMADFFSRTYDNYADFVSASTDIINELQYSNYEGVRKTWKNLYSKERDRLIGALLENITVDSFDAYFKTQVRYLCEQEFLTWDYESIDQVKIGTPQLTESGTAKQCSGEYRVHLRGNIIGIRTGIARVSISGVIGVNNAGNMVYQRTGYEFLEVPFM